MNTTRRNARGEASLQTILEETAALVGRYGYDGTTIARITQLTGKPASSLYWYFDTKDELLAAALENTYGKRPDEIPGWPLFTADSAVETQLFRALRTDFHSSETEDPVRLGIMVALEGSAAGSPVQEPFLRRRRQMQSHFASWWDSAVAAHRGSPSESVGEWMTMLTLAFYDGHYVSDIVPDADPTPRHGQMVAKALAGAFEFLLARGTGFPAPTGNHTEGEQQGAVGPSGIDSLLASTRSCVAELGYEGATLTAICERAGIQRSSIYWRYKSKDELVRAAVSEPFLELVSSSRPRTDPGGAGWPLQLADSLERCVQAAREDPDTAKAGLLLKLHRRDPLSLGSQAIQLGIAREAGELAAWVETAIRASGSVVDAGSLAWSLSVLRDGLLLGLIYGQEYTPLRISELASAMIDGMLAGNRGQ